MIELNNISYIVNNSILSSNTREILFGVNYKFPAAGASAIIGHSGSGKTTLAKIIAGIIQPTDGQIIFYNAHSDNDPSIRLLFQNSRYLLNPNRKLNSILTATMKLFGRSEDEPEIQILHANLGITLELKSRFVYQLSGGELQRAALLNLLISKPDVLVLDEPFSAQDYSSQKRLIEILAWLKTELELKLIIVSHKIRVLQGICDDFMILETGKIIESGSFEELLIKPETNFSKNLLAAEEFSLN